MFLHSVTDRLTDFNVFERPVMLKYIENLPPAILGLSAEGKVTGDEYDTLLIPLLEDKHRRGERVRFLYQFGPAFSGFTPGAAMEDCRVGLKYLRLFERCAVVTDTEWLRHATHLFGSLMPCPVRVFKNDQLNAAVEWLTSPDAGSNLHYELQDNGILIVRPQGPLRREDFDTLAGVIDPWIEVHQHLRGLVISIQKFPGWENIGSLIHHIEFVKAHHKKIRRVAVAVDGTLPEIMSRVAAHFVEAEIKQFPFKKIDEAVEWVNG